MMASHLFFRKPLFHFVVLLALGITSFGAQGIVLAQQETGASKEAIYSKLKCCDCGKPFGPCRCPDAHKIKGYVDALIESGLSQGEILLKVARKFSLSAILDPYLRQALTERLAQEAAPRIVVEPLFFNFGQRHKEEGRIAHSFQLDNRGDADLVITNIKVSCPCATASLKFDNKKSEEFGIMGAPEGWQVVVGPARSAQVEVVLDLAHASIGYGKVIRQIGITSNDPYTRQVSIRVEAEVLNSADGR